MGLLKNKTNYQTNYKINWNDIDYEKSSENMNLIHFITVSESEYHKYKRPLQHFLDNGVLGEIPSVDLDDTFYVTKICHFDKVCRLLKHENYLANKDCKFVCDCIHDWLIDDFGDSQVEDYPVIDFMDIRYNAIEKMKHMVVIWIVENFDRYYDIIFKLIPNDFFYEKLYKIAKKDMLSEMR